MLISAIEGIDEGIVLGRGLLGCYVDVLLSMLLMRSQIILQEVAAFHGRKTSSAAYGVTAGIKGACKE